MNKKMKKLGLYTMALLSLGLVACNQDFETEFVPQTNLPESKLQMSDISFAANTETTIKLSDYINEEAGTEKPILIGTVSVKEGAMPDNTTLKAEVEFSKSADFDESVVLEADIDEKNVISVKASRLQESYFNGITRNPAETPLYMRTTLYTVTGGSSVAVVGKPGENYYAQRNVQFTPLNKVQISPAYYVIGAAAGWSADGARTQKFSHSSADVYDDPIFTIVVDAGGDDCWFAIGDDAALDAIANDNDWTKLFGTKGASEDLTGTMDYRYNLGGDHSFHVTGAKKLKITLNMLEYSYTIQPINVADAYYLVGGPLDWAASSASKAQKFSHSSASVADDPIFTYVLEGTGGDIWFAIGDDEACDAIANDSDWSKLYGTTSGNGNNGLTGSLARRSSLSDEGSFKVDGTAKFIRIQINMAELTYTITPLNFSEYFYEIGGESGWSTAHALYGAAGDGKYLGYYYLDGEFKFKPNADNWDDDLEYVNGDTMSGTLTSGGGPNCPDPSAGFYQINLDASALTYNLVKVNNISIIGTVNGNWDTDTDLTYNKETGAWEVTTDLAAGNMKFRMNHDWTISWGGANDNPTAFDNLTQNGGKDLAVEAGTYKIQLFISHEGKNKVVMTKQ